MFFQHSYKKEPKTVIHYQSCTEKEQLQRMGLGERGGTILVKRVGEKAYANSTSRNATSNEERQPVEE